MSPSLAQPRGFTLRVRPPRVATRRRPAACSELACCVRRPPRVVIAGPNRSGCGRHPPRVATRRRPATCACRSADNIPYPGVNPAHKIPPRVVIVVQTPPRVTVVVPTPPRVAIVVSIQRIRSLIVCYDSPRVAIVGSNPGTAASSSCYRGSNRGQYPWRKNTGVSRGTNRGETNVSQLRVATRRRPATTVTSWVLIPIPYRPACCGRRPPRVAIAGSNRFGSRHEIAR